MKYEDKSESFWFSVWEMVKHLKIETGQFGYKEHKWHVYMPQNICLGNTVILGIGKLTNLYRHTL